MRPIMNLCFWILGCLLSLNSYGQISDLSLSDNSSFSMSIHIHVESGQTLYGLSVAAGISIQELMYYNDRESNVLIPGEVLTLPIARHKIKTGKISVKDLSLRYRVEKGDNLYKISRLIGIPVETIMSMNEKSSFDVTVSEELIVGWFEWPYLIADFIDESIMQDSIFRNDEMDSIFLQTTASMNKIEIFESTAPKSVKKRGIAFCERNTANYSELLVMHPTARVNSKISLYNPMLKRSVNATVAGELPREAYPEDISVVISSSVAQALGALDKRFLVEMTYIE